MTTLTLQPDATAGADTYLSSAQANDNYGAETELYIGKWFTALYHGLLRFNLTDLPADATVNSATLTLTISANDLDWGVDYTLNVYPMKRAWVEGEATWNIYSTGNNWGTAGGTGAADYTSTSQGSVTVEWGDSGAKNISVSGTSKAALGGDWILIGTEVENQQRVRWASSDHATAGSRPKLVIEYTAAAAGGCPRQAAYYQRMNDVA